MASAENVKALTLRSLASNLLHAVNWTKLGTPIEGACIFGKVTNAAATTVFYSFDGVNEHGVLLQNSADPLPFQLSSSLPSKRCTLGKGTQIWLRGAPVGGGLIYFTGFYQ